MIRKEPVELVLPYIPATVNFHVQPPRTENLFTYPATPNSKKDGGLRAECLFLPYLQYLPPPAANPFPTRIHSDSISFLPPHVRSTFYYLRSNRHLQFTGRFSWLASHRDLSSKLRSPFHASLNLIGLCCLSHASPR